MDNLPVEWAILLISLTAFAPLLKDFALWVLQRRVKQLEVTAEANVDNSVADNNRQESIAKSLDNQDRMVKMIQDRDQTIIQLQSQVSEQNGRLIKLEAFRGEFEQEKQLRVQFEKLYSAERQRNIELEEALLVEQDKSRVAVSKNRELEDRIQTLEGQLKALEEKFSRLENVRISQEVPIVTENKDNGN